MGEVSGRERGGGVWRAIEWFLGVLCGFETKRWGKEEDWDSEGEREEVMM